MPVSLCHPREPELRALPKSGQSLLKERQDLVFGSCVSCWALCEAGVLKPAGRDLLRKLRCCNYYSRIEGWHQDLEVIVLPRKVLDSGERISFLL